MYKEGNKMLFAKYIDEETVIRCPRNGYIENKAISNLNIYLKNHPEVAKKEGYLKFIPCKNDNFEDLAKYKPVYDISNSVITERMIEIDY